MTIAWGPCGSERLYLLDPFGDIRKGLLTYTPEYSVEPGQKFNAEEIAAEKEEFDEHKGDELAAIKECLEEEKNEHEVSDREYLRQTGPYRVLI